MPGNGTVVTIGHATVSVPSSAALTGLLLASLRSALEGEHVDELPSVVGTVTVPAPTGPGNAALVIPEADDGEGKQISLPPGYQSVIYQGLGSLTGGDAHTAVLGDFISYDGPAGTVIGTGSIGGAVSDTTPDAVMSFAAGANSVTAGGSGQTVMADAGTNWIEARERRQFFEQSGGASTVNSSSSVSGASTAVATGGDMTFFGFGSGDDVVSVSGTSTRLQFLGNGGIDTITAGAGADTIFAGAAVYHGASGSDLFVGGTGMSTLYGAANETIYSGSGGGVWNLAPNSSDAWMGGGGADTVMLGAGTTAAQLWTDNDESLSLGAASGTSGGVIIAFGQNTNIDMTNAAGNDTVLLWNAQIGGAGGFAFTGNTTLTASNAGHDLFAMFGAAPFGAGTEAPHTIVVNNWQASDIFDLSTGYSAADAQAATQALAAGSSFTLSDGTTVQFNGAKPTTIIHS
jgi:hypothetical protein